jgi:putative transposase
MDWTRILAYVTGTVDQELLARNEYLATENRILKSQLNGRLKLSDAERAMLGKIGHGRTSFGPTWRCWLGLTSSRRRC